MRPPGSLTKQVKMKRISEATNMHQIPKPTQNDLSRSVKREKEKERELTKRLGEKEWRRSECNVRRAHRFVATSRRTEVIG